MTGTERPCVCMGRGVSVSRAADCLGHAMSELRGWRRAVPGGWKRAPRATSFCYLRKQS